jgi:hypothetical protein
MIFDDWEENLPVITPERVATPVEATLDFFSVKKERRNTRLNYTIQYEDQSKISTNKIKRSIWEISQSI